MDSTDIINNIREFFVTADEKALSEVKAAASIKIEGDISIVDYLSGFSNEYFYVNSCKPNCYTSEDMQIQTTDRQYKETGFEGAQSSYGATDLNITLDMEPSHKGEVTKMIKEAA